MNIRSATNGSLRRDGGRMAFLTDMTGTHQLWTVDEATGWPDQLTFFEDRLMFASYGPHGSGIAFGIDAGGNEDQLIFLNDDEGGLPERLSPTDAKHMWGGWSHDGRSMAWSHNGRNGRDFDLYVFDLTTRTERCILEVEGFNYVAAWLHDDRHLIVGRADSNTNNDLWVLNIETGELLLLTEHDGEAFFSTPCPAPDGKTAYVLTNAGRDFNNLATLNLETGGFRFVDDYTWDRELLAMSDDGRWLAIGTNENGYSRLELRDLVSDTEHVVESLEGSILGALEFAPDSAKLIVTVSRPNDSTDIWTVAAATGETTRWTRSSLAGIRRDAMVEPELVHFESFDGLEVPAFYYKPAGPGPFPVVIEIHGGPEAQRRPVFMSSLQYFVQSGFAVLSPNVRGSRGYGQAYMALDDVEKRMDSVRDIEAAHGWLIEHGQADPNKIALLGGSYGGFMVLSAMVTFPDLWAAGVDIVGIANFVTFLENTSEYRRHLRESEYGSLERDREFLTSISPLTHIERIDAPLMVIHGRNDPRVPVSEAEQVAGAVRNRGQDVELLIYDDEGHGLAKRSNRLDAYPRVADFLRRHLLGE
ncbi:MAG: S9 family peptidase [Bradymonadaceae bacterium]